MWVKSDQRVMPPDIVGRSESKERPARVCVLRHAVRTASSVLLSSVSLPGCYISLICTGRDVVSRLSLQLDGNTTVLGLSYRHSHRLRYQTPVHNVAQCACGTVLLQTPTVPPLVEKYPEFYRKRRFTTVFTTARQLSLSSARSIQALSPHPISLKGILTLPSYLRPNLRSCLPSRFLHQHPRCSVSSPRVPRSQPSNSS